MLWRKDAELLLTRMPGYCLFQEFDTIIGSVIIHKKELHLLQSLVQQTLRTFNDVLCYTVNR